MKTYFRNVWLGLATILASMKVTARHLFLPSVTLQYPYEKRDLEGWQGSADKVFTRHQLEVDIDDCIGCLQCERACPVECIKIETIKTLPGEDLGKASTGNPKRLWVARFEIDMEKCCYCGLCIYPCPTSCIHMTDNYEYSVYNKEEHIYQFGLMTEEEAAAKRAEVAEAVKKEKEAKAKKAAEEAKAKAAEERPAAEEAGQKPTEEEKSEEKPAEESREEKEEES
jgi:NADH-quinone oxidoreductase subunit I